MTQYTTSIGIHDLDEVWDCLVIGAGPAGAMAARRAALQGLRTLIVDRKPFPREKVCGACVNRRALALLERVGLGQVVINCRGIPLDHFLLRCQGEELSLPLPGGIAISRATLDEALVREAVAAGATFVPATTGQVLAVDRPMCERAIGVSRDRNQRSVRLTDNRTGESQQPDSRTIHARAVVAADGLGHPSLQSTNEFRDSVAPTSRIGIGTLVAQRSDSVCNGTVGMAAARGGYVGMVRIQGGRLNVAACLDARVLRNKRHPGVVVADILQQAGFADFGAADQDWKGTIQLTRSVNTAASRGIFVVGDSAGYVEPFTGEGIAWALLGGVTVADCAVSAVRTNPLAAEKMWRRELHHLVLRQQKWCRRLALLVRHPTAVSMAIRAASIFPSFAQGIIASLNSPALELKVSQL